MFERLTPFRVKLQYPTTNRSMNFSTAARVASQLWSALPAKSAGGVTPVDRVAAEHPRRGNFLGARRRPGRRSSRHDRGPRFSGTRLDWYRRLRSSSLRDDPTAETQHGGRWIETIDQAGRWKQEEPGRPVLEAHQPHGPLSWLVNVEQPEDSPERTNRASCPITSAEVGMKWARPRRQRHRQNPDPSPLATICTRARGDRLHQQVRTTGSSGGGGTSTPRSSPSSKFFWILRDHAVVEQKLLSRSRARVIRETDGRHDPVVLGCGTLVNSLQHPGVHRRQRQGHLQHLLEPAPESGQSIRVFGRLSIVRGRDSRGASRRASRRLCPDNIIGGPAKEIVDLDANFERRTRPSRSFEVSLSTEPKSSCTGQPPGPRPDRLRRRSRAPQSRLRTRSLAPTVACTLDSKIDGYSVTGSRRIFVWAGVDAEEVVGQARIRDSRRSGGRVRSGCPTSRDRGQ